MRITNVQDVESLVAIFLTYLQLPLEDAYRAGIVMHLIAAHSIAAPLLAFELDDDAERRVGTEVGVETDPVDRRRVDQIDLDPLRSGVGCRPPRPFRSVHGVRWRRHELVGLLPQ